jgi:hypothetical protein
MSIEAGLYRTQTAPPRAATLDYVEKADTTLAAVSTALRRGTPLPDDLPDLRQAHNAIIESNAAPTERYELIDVETDRITTSLNTLSEQVDAWVRLRFNKPGLSQALGSKRIADAEK